MEKKRMVVTLSGNSFNIVSTDSEAYMRKLEGMVNRRLDATARKYPGLSVNRCAMICMLNMADELEKMRESVATPRQAVQPMQLQEKPSAKKPVGASSLIRG